MFESAASEIREAVQAWQASDTSALSESAETIRQRCKEVIVYLESCDQAALASRVEREYERMKQIWSGVQVRDSTDDALRVVDVANELCATLSALTKYQRKLDQTPAIEPPVEHKHTRWAGWSEWENWGAGLAADGSWHLYHFQRKKEFRWVRHRHVSVPIPGGIPDGLARKLMRFGFVGLKDAHEVLRDHATGPVEQHVLEVQVIAKIKSPMSRLRAAIKQAIQNEGYKLAGLPISSPTKNAKNWRAKIKFAHLIRRDGGGYYFQPRY